MPGPYERPLKIKPISPFDYNNIHGSEGIHVPPCLLILNCKTHGNTNCIFLIGIHSMQGWTATARYGVSRKKKLKMIKAYMKSV